jgi:hypothetical protein
MCDIFLIIKISTGHSQQDTIRPPMFLYRTQQSYLNQCIERPHIKSITADLFCRWYVLPLFKDYPPLRPLLMNGKLLTLLSGYLRVIVQLFLSLNLHL